jgi:hypothetical protein
VTERDFRPWTPGVRVPLPLYFQLFTDNFELRARENGVTTGFALPNCIITNDAATTATLAFTVEENGAAGTLKSRTNVA